MGNIEYERYVGYNVIIRYTSYYNPFDRYDEDDDYIWDSDEQEELQEICILGEVDNYVNDCFMVSCNFGEACVHIDDIKDIVIVGRNSPDLFYRAVMFC